jgi:hypothetical protein
VTNCRETSEREGVGVPLLCREPLRRPTAFEDGSVHPLAHADKDATIEVDADAGGNHLRDVPAHGLQRLGKDSDLDAYGNVDRVASHGKDGGLGVAEEAARGGGSDVNQRRAGGRREEGQSGDDWGFDEKEEELSICSQQKGCAHRDVVDLAKSFRGRSAAPLPLPSESAVRCMRSAILAH